MMGMPMSTEQKVYNLKVEAAKIGYEMATLRKQGFFDKSLKQHYEAKLQEIRDMTQGIKDAEFSQNFVRPAMAAK